MRFQALYKAEILLYSTNLHPILPSTPLTLGSAIPPFRIVAFCLFFDVEITVLPEIVSYACNVSLVAVITACIIIGKDGFEPPGAGIPVLLHIIYKIAGYQLPSPIAQISGISQLIHTSVNKRLTRSCSHRHLCL